MDDDFDIDDILGDGDKPKKRVNSGSKGKRGEIDLGKILSTRFPSHPPFSRVLGSGNRWAQVKMSKNAQEVLTGDLVCPPGFRYSIECKFGYEGIDIPQAIVSGNKLLDDFLAQGSHSARIVEKEALVCWRRPRKDWIAFVASELPVSGNRIIYEGWIGIPLTKLLELPDSHFFTG